MNSIWIGFDTREGTAFGVCRDSIRRHLTTPIPIYGLVLDHLKSVGLYNRPMQVRGSKHRQLWDVISDAPMATEFSNSRFLVNHLARAGYALFLDCDMLVRADLTPLFTHCRKDASKAVWCVKHMHEPKTGFKMDGQHQTRYMRKNWSSLVVWNIDHPSNKTLTVEMINTVPGRDLHRFCWLTDEEIGELEPKWNWLVGYSAPIEDPLIIHFTSGGPWMEGFEDVPYADEWRLARNLWAGA